MTYTENEISTKRLSLCEAWHECNCTRKQRTSIMWNDRFVKIEWLHQRFLMKQVLAKNWEALIAIFCRSSSPFLVDRVSFTDCWVPEVVVLWLDGKNYGQKQIRFNIVFSFRLRFLSFPAFVSSGGISPMAWRSNSTRTRTEYLHAVTKKYTIFCGNGKNINNICTYLWKVYISFYVFTKKDVFSSRWKHNINLPRKIIRYIFHNCCFISWSNGGFHPAKNCSCFHSINLSIRNVMKQIEFPEFVGYFVLGCHGMFHCRKKEEKNPM